MSLLLAALIWLVASQEKNPVLLQSYELPLSIVGKPADSTLDLSTDTIVVIVEAPSNVLRNLSSDDFSAVLDLSQIPLGEEVFIPVTIKPKVSGVTVNTPSPDTVRARLDQLITREIPVVLDIRGSAARGHTQGEALADPQTIIVVGTSEQVEPLDSARVTVFLNNVRETVVTSPFPIFYDRQGRVASSSGLHSVSHESVQVTIPVAESADFAEKIIDVDWTGSPADGYRLLGISVDPPTVLLQGLPTRLTALAQVLTEPIDITGLTETFSQQVTLNLPDGITMDGGDDFSVTVEIEPILSTAVYIRPVEFQGIGKGLTASADPEDARIALFGPLPILDSLTEDEVRVTVDTFGLLTGTYSLEPVVTFPERGLELRSVQPPLITVEITATITNSLTTTETSRLIKEGITAVSAKPTTNQKISQNNDTSHPPLPGACSLSLWERIGSGLNLAIHNRSAIQPCALREEKTNL
ncbi:MAG: CdaR family protein [Chloroflexota bacterium]